MDIKVLGPGCNNCKKLFSNTEMAVKELNIEAHLEKVESLQAIASYGVMKTPALIINEQVKAMGRVPSTEEIKGIIKDVL